MSGDNPISDEDRNLFLEAVGEVRRMEQRHVPSPAKRPPARALQAEADERAVLDELLADPSEADLLETGEHLSWARDGVQKAVLRKLRAQRYSIQGELDLHGMTQHHAREQLLGFIEEARRRGRYCVRIIHGKGRRHPDKGPVLKPSVNFWLQHHKRVLAFCSAPPHDGGTGAVYVLLRK
ncbi:Smr/MutS family protein [Granulosicoccaceae sp. 1_MG-2023]|nr:Smr/MutS family protein [Granulosicoccaceae sp. 1_MG-2023]